MIVVTSSVKAISERLILHPSLVEEVLQRLAEFGIVQKLGKTWILGTRDVHIPKESLMIGIHHNNWRQKAVTDSSMVNKESIHYTAIYSMSRSDFRDLKKRILDVIEHSRNVVEISKEEDIVCFTCDLFSV